MEETGSGESVTATCCLAAALWATGWGTDPLFFSETAQQVLFAQQWGLHAFSLGAFERMQDAAGNRRGATARASTMTTRVDPALRIPILSTITPPVDP